GADVLGALLVTGSLMLAVYTIAESSVYGLASTHTLVSGSISLVLLGAFIARQAMASNPILPLRLFASRRLAASNAVQALMSSAFFGFFFLGSLDLERVLGYGPMAIGLAFLPVAAVMAAFSIRFSAQLIGRFGAGRRVSPSVAGRRGRRDRHSGAGGDGAASQAAGRGRDAECRMLRGCSLGSCQWPGRAKINATSSASPIRTGSPNPIAAPTSIDPPRNIAVRWTALPECISSTARPGIP